MPELGLSGSDLLLIRGINKIFKGIRRHGWPELGRNCRPTGSPLTSSEKVVRWSSLLSVRKCRNRGRQ
jgi:hypothetical protein